ncbi:MAG: hypothetical protein ABSF50_14360 [Burkholderiaceae bacterium]
MHAANDAHTDTNQHDPANASPAVRRVLAERVLRLVALTPQGVLITNLLQADRALGGPLAKLAPEGVIALIREMLENDYLQYVAGSARLVLAPGYRQLQQAL